MLRKNLRRGLESLQGTLSSTLILAIATVPLMLALLREATHPIFIGLSSYSFLIEQSLTRKEWLIVQIILLIIFAVSLAIANKIYTLPKTMPIVLVATPAFLQAIIKANGSLLYATCAIILLLLLRLPIAPIFGAAIIAATVPNGIILALATLVYLGFEKRYTEAVILGVTLLPVATYFQQELVLVSAPAFTTATGVFILALAATSLFVGWSKKLYGVQLALAVFFLALSIVPQGLILQATLAAALCGWGIDTIIKRNWSLESVAYTTSMLIICGLLFSTVSTAAIDMRQGPNDQEFEVAKLTSQLAQGQEVFVAEPYTDAFKFWGVKATNQGGSRILSASTESDLSTSPDTIVLTPEQLTNQLALVVENSPNYAYAKKEPLIVIVKQSAESRGVVINTDLIDQKIS